MTNWKAIRPKGNMLRQAKRSVRINHFVVLS
jgi:hypothetical protein